MYKNILVPIVDSAISSENVSKAVDFALFNKSKITFYNAHPDFLATQEGALLSTMAPEIYVDRERVLSKGILAKAQAAAKMKEVPCHLVHSNCDRPAVGIIKAAAEEGCDLIFMASHGARELGGLFMGSETLKVIASSPIPVLVSSVQNNVDTPEMITALAIIQDEHRSIASVLSGWLYIVGELDHEIAADDLTVMNAMYKYLKEYPQAEHHPKEEEYIFKILRRRSSDFDGLIEELRFQHNSGETLLNSLGEALIDYEAKGISSLANLRSEVKRFAVSQWKHMALEEQVIIPAAKRCFLPQDWLQTADAFNRNKDPKFGAIPKEDYEQLFIKIAAATTPDH